MYLESSLNELFGLDPKSSNRFNCSPSVGDFLEEYIRNYLQKIKNKFLA